MGRVRCGAMSIHNLPEAFAEIQVSPTCTGDVKTCYALAIRGRPAEDCTMCKKVHVCLHAETRNREKMVKQTHLKGNVRVPLAANRSRYPLTIIHLVFFHSRCCGGVRLFFQASLFAKGTLGLAAHVRNTQFCSGRSC